MSDYHNNGFSRKFPPLEIDTSQALTQLYALGYRDGDKVFLRSFEPKKRKGGMAPMWEYTLPNLPTQQDPRLGLYFTVNGGGHDDCDVQQGRALFWEWDKLPIPDQLTAWQRLGLEPNLQIVTRKSVHNYLVISGGCSVEEWRELQLDLLAFFPDSDQKLKNPSRVLRLAGGWHISKDGHYRASEKGVWSYHPDGEASIKCEIVHQCSNEYTYQQLRERIPHRAMNTTSFLPTGYAPKPSWPQFDRAFKLPATVIVPLESCLSRDDRQLIESGCGVGSRNDSGFKLAVNLLATAAYLDSVGQQYEGIPEELFYRYCRNCNAGDGWDENEWGAVWKSAEKKQGGTSLNPDQIAGCIKAQEWKRVVGEWERHNTGVTPTQGVTQAQNPAVQGNSEQPVLSVATQAEKDQFSLLQEMRGTKFDVDMVIPSMASDTKHDAALMSVDPVAIWAMLLPAVLSLMGKITIDFSGFKVPNIVWSVLAQKSGRGKTRAIGLVTASLWEMERKAEEEYKFLMQNYKDACKLASKNNEEEPEKPIRKKVLFNIATPQAVVKRLGEQDNGALWARDEFKGLVSGLNQFSKEGEGLEILLETWDGKPAQVDRVSTEDSFFVAESRLSLAGGIQPGMLKKVFDPEDPQGVMARMLIVTCEDREYRRVKGSPVLANKLPQMYEWIRHQDWSGMGPSAEADDLFTTIAEYFNNAHPPNDALDAWLKKAPGHVLRVATGIHAIECYHDKAKNPKFITRDTLMRAYYYVSLCRNWLFSLQGAMAENTNVSSLLQKILDKTAALGNTATLPDLYRNINAIRGLAKSEGRPISELTQALCTELEEMGKGTLVSDEKGRLLFRLAPPQHSQPKTFVPPKVEPVLPTHTPPTQGTPTTHVDKPSFIPPIRTGVSEAEIATATPSTQSPTVAPEPAYLEVGQRVRVNKSISAFNGVVGQIVSVEGTNGGTQYIVSVALPDGKPVNRYFTREELILL